MVNCKIKCAVSPQDNITVAAEFDSSDDVCVRVEAPTNYDALFINRSEIIRLRDHLNKLLEQR